MATWANINTPTLTPAAAPSSNALTATTDQFAAQYGARYLVRIHNGAAVPTDVRVVDPNIPAVPGRAFTNAYAIAATVPVGQARSILLEAARFLDSNGNIVLEYSASIVHAASLAEIYKI